MAQVKGIQEKSCSIDWTQIVQLTEKSRMVNTHFRVLKKSMPRIVTQKTSGRKFEVVDCIVGDQTARINLTLWNEDIDVIEEGRTYSLLNGVINLYDECISLTRGKHGELIESIDAIENVNDQVDMSKPFMWKPKRKEKPRSPYGRSFQGTAGRESKGYCARKSF